MTRDAVLAITLLLVVGLATLTGRSAQQDGSAPMLPPAPTTRPTTAPSPQQAALEAAMNRQLDEARFEDAPFEDVVAQIGKSAKVNIVVNWTELEEAGVTRATAVSTRFRGTTMANVLRVVLREAADKGGLEYVVGDGLITITTRAARLRNAPTRQYDVRDVLVDPPNVRPRADVVANLIRLIMKQVDPESWAKVEPITERDGVLAIKTLDENHRSIAALLDKIRETRGIQVGVELVLLSLPDDFWDTHQDQLGDIGIGLGKRFSEPGHERIKFLEVPEAKQLLDEVRKDRNAKVLSSPRVLVLNGQQAMVAVGTDVPYISGIKAVAGADGRAEFQQQSEKLFNGLHIEVKPMVSADRQYVTIKTQATLTDLRDLEKIPFKDGPADKSLYTQRPRVDIREMSTIVSVPDNGTMVLEGFRKRSGDEVAGQGKPVWDVLLLLKPTIVIKKPGEADQAFPLLRPAK